ncbi:serine acetyltransferase [Paenibacillus sp. 1011MAR3C5]|uniref:serine acetyltransferase n=1 Tax=Paenibacillus sp. 1011MAR3C5 TaxID=1675787 RepID=UPI000E6B5ACF|nr:serine acetyltransferase [Paenibacillus sp. 1011MAR3C5]RJE85649.1 serine acetyltransferase [Paenibacillus sp. 1011MAR3C5]
MITSLTTTELKSYISSQLNLFFPDKYKFEGHDVDSAMGLALERTEYCFKHITLRGFTQDGQAYFSHLHSDQYSQFLFFLSNSLWKISENRPLCDKLIFLNKALNGLFYSYKSGLPDIFLFGHPVGSIIGNAVYSDFLVIFQNVTINTDEDENGNPAPRLGKGLFLGAGAKIIGNKPIGDRVSIGVDALVHNTAIESDSVVIKDSTGNVIISKRKKDQCMAQRYFSVEIK